MEGLDLAHAVDSRRHISVFVASSSVVKRARLLFQKESAALIGDALIVLCRKGADAFVLLDRRDIQR